MKIIILGAGLVGKAMAMDLASSREFDVTAVDLRKEPLKKLKNKGICAVTQKDLSSAERVRQTIKSFDVVVNALPGYLGFNALKACLEMGKNVVDITFFSEDPFKLHELAEKNRAAAIVDCGLAPGLSHMLAAQALSQLDEGRSLTIYVGGLPVVRTWPFEYKTVFSPADVIEEYSRPARYKENGQIMTKLALSEPELIEFEGLGTLEAFNTDGLRTLLQTLPLGNMKEKTLRYPGHREKIVMLKEAGFFEAKPITINGKKSRPVDITAKILFPRLQLQPGEEDLTVMRIIVNGKKSDRPCSIRYELLDHFDRKSGVHSMARTTGYTAAMVVRAMVRGLIKKGGIIPPEFLGFDRKCFQFILKGLKKRGIRIEKKQDVGNPPRLRFDVESADDAVDFIQL